MKPSCTLRRSSGPLLGGWDEIADDVAAIAAVMRVSDGSCHCVHDRRAFCSCCAASSAHIHEVCEGCNRLLQRLEAACAALEDHSLRFAPALMEHSHADELTRTRFVSVCTLAGRLRHLLFAVEVRTATAGGDQCRTADLVQLAPVATELTALARELADTVTRKPLPTASA